MSIGGAGLKRRNGQMIETISRVSLKWLAALLLFVSFPLPAAGLATGSVVIDLTLGQMGDASELIRAPLLGRQANDPTWLYDTNPDGTDNPLFPPPLPPFALPLQVPLPAPIVDLSQVWLIFGVPGQVVDPSGDTGSNVFPSLWQRTMAVNAAATWAPSGYDVKVGDRISLEVSGNWSWHLGETLPDNTWSGPEGDAVKGPLMNDPYYLWPGHSAPVPTANQGAFVARIGNNPAFFVGNGLRFISTQSGQLAFMSNDLYDGGGARCSICNFFHVSNNVGDMTVIIRVDSPFGG
jgi:hypothetical protein